MLTLRNKILACLAASSGLTLTVATPSSATPIQCYIGKNGSYQICEINEIEPSKYVLVWPDGERTAIIQTNTPSGSWIDVRHANSSGEIYGGGTRYPRTHYEQGEWLCYHRQPDGGDIDFCVTK